MTLYADVTARIIAELEKGATPWIKPWNAGAAAGADCNAFTLKPYRGINRLLLAMSGVRFSSNRWATFKQWQAAGANVRKGEKGTHITFYKPLTIEEMREGELHSKNVAVLKSFVVFNADQVDGIQFEPVQPKPEGERLEHCEQTIRNTGAMIRHGGDVACFVPSADLIRMPELSTFADKANYYATAFHELVHWTGSDKRLDRVFGQRFGDSAYAFEELVAELGAAMLCADHQIQGDLRHAGYIDHWLKCLRDNDRAIFKAAALAEKAASFIQSYQEEEELAAA